MTSTKLLTASAIVLLALSATGQATAMDVQVGRVTAAVSTTDGGGFDNGVIGKLVQIVLNRLSDNAHGHH